MIERRIRRPGDLLVLTLLAIEVLLCAAYAVNILAGRPFRMVTRHLNLDGEANIPAWFSSLQLALAALLLGIFAWSHYSRQSPRSWLLLLLPGAFLALSLDEASQLHEYLGGASDALLPGGSRKETVFSRTGIWMLLVGPPAAVAAGLIVWAVRPFFAGTGRALTKIAAGMALLIIAATGVETLSNFTSGALNHLQIMTEEFLEMTAVTLVVWAGVDLLRVRGVRLVIQPTQDTAAPSVAPSQAADTSTNQAA